MTTQLNTDSPLSEWVEQRRDALKRALQACCPNPSEGELPPPEKGDPMWGLALSGGGIRSATFALGLLTGLAKKGILQRIDVLSTVSGGGYIGAAIGKLYSNNPSPASSVAPSASAQHAGGSETTAAPVEPLQRRIAVMNDSWFVWWLRATSRYLTPRGSKDLLRAFAMYIRELLAVHTELGLAAMALGATLALYDLFIWHQILAWFSSHPDSIDRLGPLLQPWMSGVWLLMIVPLLASIPLATGYWSIPSQREKRLVITDVILSALMIMASVALGIAVWTQDNFWSSQRDGVLRAFCGAFAAFLFLAALGPVAAYLARPRASRVGDKEPSAQPDIRIAPARTAGFVNLNAVYSAANQATIRILNTNVETQYSQEQRNQLTKYLAACLQAAFVLLLLGVVDRLAWLLAVERGNYSYFLPAFVAVGLAGARVFAADLPNHDPTAAISGRFVFKLAELAGTILFGLLLTCWVAFVYRLGLVNLFGSAETGELMFMEAFGVLLAFVFAPVAYMALTATNWAFCNLSSLHMFYRARLTRSYLGASNANRFVVSSDSSGSATPADPLSKVLPQDLVHVADRPSVFEVDRNDDVAMNNYKPQEAGGPIHLVNVTVNQTKDPLGGLFNQDRKGEYLSVTSGGYYRVGRNQWACDPSFGTASLSSWVAISGAAVAPGLGGQTSFGLSILVFMSGLRLGYWWDKGADPGRWRRFLDPVKYRLLFGEAFAKFDGTAKRFWYLSDGGHFENTGAYSLLRERAKLIVLSDAAADPHYSFNDLENLTRKARIDLNTEIEFVDFTKIPVQRFRYFGTLDQLRDPQSDACVALARIKYPQINTSPDQDLAGWLVYVKPNVFRGLPVDLINFKQDNPNFPQEPTTDQFFSESQWESYYRLGCEIGQQLDGNLLAQIASNQVPELLESLATQGQALAGSRRIVEVQKDLPFTARFPRAVGLATSGLSFTAIVGIATAGWQAWDKMSSDTQKQRSAYQTELNAASVLHERVLNGESALLPELTARLAAATETFCSRGANPFGITDRTAAMVMDVKSRCGAGSNANGVSKKSTPACDTLLGDDAGACFHKAEHAPGERVYWGLAYADPGWAKTRVANLSAVETVASGQAQVTRAVANPAPPTAESPVSAASERRSPVQSRSPASVTPAANATVAAETQGDAACRQKLVYIQVYTGTAQQQVDDIKRLLSHQQARIRPIQDVSAGAMRDGRPAPRPVSAPTVIYHTESEHACANQLLHSPALNSTEAPAKSRPLGAGLIPTPGVLEIWLPPSASAANVTSR